MAGERQRRAETASSFEEQHHADHAIADALHALDSLDADEAEQVFHRALELEAEAISQPHMFTAEQLERIADEINMDVAFVRQALGEVRLAPDDRSWIDERILPDPIMAVETIEGIPRADLDALIDDWMIGHEGLIQAGNLADGTQWDVDRRFAARMRAMRLSGGNRISRTAGGDITHRVQSLSDDEHVVAMQSVGEGPLVLGKLGIAAAAALVAVGAITGLDGTFVDFIQSLATFAVLGAGVAGASIAGARRWAKGIGRALKRSITGLTGRLGGVRRRDNVDIKPVVTELLRTLTERVRVERERRASAPSAPRGPRHRRPPAPPSRQSRRRRPPPPPSPTR